ncbi:OB-fold nucleic acid binding domain-containing protein, partial [Phenylobacterium aquaticum]|uniref:OB-fold nucleic acid binding domain-containing protein n=1 Tax=Phenylobacterium aquaticum TaxID=1763816 RepID=UPI0034CF7740
QIKGLKREDGEALVALRARGVSTVEGLARHLPRRALELLAEADAFAGIGLDRRQALWAVKGLVGETRVETEAPLLAAMGRREVQVELPLMSLPLQVSEDYRTTRLSLKAHPCSFFRDRLQALGAVPASAFPSLRDGRRVSVGGLVLVRQRPGTARGVVFMTLEDETGSANIVVWRDVFEANRRLVMSAAFVVVHGQLQREGDVIHLVAKRFTDLSHMTAALKAEGPGPGRGGPLQASRDFH